MGGRPWPHLRSLYKGRDILPEFGYPGHNHIQVHRRAFTSLVLHLLFTMVFSSLLAGVGASIIFTSLALANPLPDPVANLVPRQTITPGGPPCGQNNATNRRCWKNSWSVNTDYEVTNPPAFNTRVVSSTPSLAASFGHLQGSSTISISPISQAGQDQMVR
jgi:hypothetical protein